MSLIMAGIVSKLFGIRSTPTVLIGLLVVVSLLCVSADPSLKQEAKNQNGNEEVEKPIIRSGYMHVWPDMKFGWKIVVGSIVAFFGSALGSVGGVGGGVIFNLLLILIIGFDPKSSIALSKCMITGAATATVFYNLRQRHPTLEQPVIDYDLALLFQPMLVLGISIGVAFNVIFADWMITILIIILYLSVSMATKTFLRGVATWKKETIIKMEAAKVGQVEESKCEPESFSNKTSEKKVSPKRSEVSILENVYRKELGCSLEYNPCFADCKDLKWVGSNSSK